MSQTTTAKLAEPVGLSEEMRDGLLQDLLGVGMILRRLEQIVPEAAPEIASASAAIEQDVRAVREIIERLRAAA